MTTDQIQAAGEAAAVAIATWPDRTPNAVEMTTLIVTAARLYTPTPTHADLDAITTAADQRLVGIRNAANMLRLAMAKPEGGVH